MHFVKVERRLNRVTGIEVLIGLMSYMLKEDAQNGVCSSDPLKVRERGRDFWMKKFDVMSRFIYRDR